MLIQIIVDYSYLYYKYKFQLDSGKMRRLTYPMEWHGAVMERDISQIYYSIKEIEGFRRKLEAIGHNVFVSVCFDEKSDKHKNDDVSEAARKYKSSRIKHLTDDDFEAIRFVEKLLSDAGYNTYRFDGHESDDTIAYIVKHFAPAFDYNVIYTPDLDIISNVSTNVGVSRYKSTKGYSSVDINNFTTYLEAELKCQMPYNALTLYKSTVGDKSDDIDGIKKFGPKAFNKLVDHLTSHGINWEQMGDCDQVKHILTQLMDSGYFTPEQGAQALDCLTIVRPLEGWEEFEIHEPTKHSTREMREASYMRLGMKSLVD